MQQCTTEASAPASFKTTPCRETFQYNNNDNYYYSNTSNDNDNNQWITIARDSDCQPS